MFLSCISEGSYVSVGRVYRLVCRFYVIIACHTSGQFVCIIPTICKEWGRVHFNYGALQNPLKQKWTQLLNLYSNEMVINERELNGTDWNVFTRQSREWIYMYGKTSWTECTSVCTCVCLYAFIFYICTQRKKTTSAQEGVSKGSSWIIKIRCLLLTPLPCQHRYPTDIITWPKEETEDTDNEKRKLLTMNWRVSPHVQHPETVY